MFLALPSSADSPSSSPEKLARHQAMAYSPQELRNLARTNWFAEQERGYQRIQETKPALIAISQTDSPVGLLSWIYDVLHNWSDHEHYDWPDDEVLTWVSIYYFGVGGIAASVRIYYESGLMPLQNTENASG